MKNILILLLSPLFSQAQLTSIVFSGDTAFVLNPSTGVRTQLNKFPAAPANILDAYPVGSIYISVNSTNPSQLFGGTWEAFAVGRTLIGLNPNDTDFDTAEETGGSKTVTLTEGQLPAHSHIIPDVRSATTGGASTRIARTVDASSTAGGDVTTATAGSGESINILNPYLTVYLFKRTQ